ncbi:MAG: ROK family transcriptional regulator [Anaerolineales bacterium]|nr:ROK family transcriptional regulator [Anaerolineales bacterium]
MIHNEAPVSRAQIAQSTGLNKSTVSSLVEDLLHRKLVHETGINSVGTGRPATLLEINPRAGGIIGIELGVDFVAVALTDFTGQILWRKMAYMEQAEAQDATIAETLKLAQQAIDFCHKQDLHLLGLGLATPGTVDLEEGVLIFAPNLHWKNVPLRKIYSEQTGLNVFIENDANAATIAEHLFGQARNSRDFIFVFAGVGIGSGLFLNGKLHRGKNGYAGEIGHSPIMAEPFQTPCHCGNRGCWETYGNQHSIIRRIQTRLDAKRDSIIPGLMAEQNSPLSISIIKQAADAGDAEAIAALSEAGEAMGVGFASLINILNPEKIILGGPLSIVGDYLLPSIKGVATKYSLPEMRPMVEIVLSSFETDASLIGAVSIVVDDILSNPTHVERR